MDIEPREWYVAASFSWQLKVRYKLESIGERVFVN